MEIDFEGALTGSPLFDLVVELALPYLGENREKARIVFITLCIYDVPALPCDLAKKHLKKLAAVVDTARPAREAVPDRDVRLRLSRQILELGG